MTKSDFLYRTAGETNKVTHDGEINWQQPQRQAALKISRIYYIVVKKNMKLSDFSCWSKVKYMAHLM